MANEKRLIDANALKDSFCDACSTNKRYQRTNDECRSNRDSYGNGCFKMRLIDSAPTVDAVEVVRCKDCKSAEPYTRMDGKTGFYCKHQKCTLRYGTNWERLYMPIKEADDFCSYGERRDG